MKRDPAVDAWLARDRGALGEIAKTWYARMRSLGADVRELIHDGMPTACVDDAAFAYVNAFTAHVNVGFFNGARLEDPAGLLEGSGRFMRHVKLRPGMAINEAALKQLVRDAYADMRSGRSGR